jgi:outer membrane lipoprotein-sorting protein
MKTTTPPALLLTLLTLLTAGQTTAAHTTADPQTILEKTTRIHQQWNGTHLRFTTNIHSDKNNITENIEGTLTIKADKIQLTTPDILIWYNGTTQWTYIPKTAEVNITTPTGNDLRHINPLTILQNHRRDYNATYLGESTTPNAKTAYDIALTPVKKNDEIKKIEIQIEKSTSQPTKLTITMNNDLQNTIHIQEIKETDPPEATFTFPQNKYPDAYINDLR